MLAITLITFVGCERVVDVDLDTAEPRLVIDASIHWLKGTDGAEQTIYLTTTTGYYNTQIPTVSNAVITVTNGTTTFDFIETEPGTYVCTDFVPALEQTYVLTVIANGQTYTATETLKAVPEVGEIEQNNEGGFTGEDIEVKIFFTDNGATDDYYLSRFKVNFNAIPEFDVTEDKFFQGNTIFALFSDEDLEAGSTLDFRLSGISQRYYNYMNILLSISGSNGGSPFSSPPATVRGNIVNTSDPDNYALGYFSLSESVEVNYVVH